MFTLYIVFCIVCAVVALVSFFLYVRARMAGLERQEKRYLSIHIISLCLFVFFGVLILIHLSDSITRGTSYSWLRSKVRTSRLFVPFTVIK